MGEEAWQFIRQWARELGGIGLIVAVLGWWLKRRIENRDQTVERGQRLVDEARPELEPVNNAGTHYQIALTVRNRGRDTARTLRIGFTGVPDIKSVDNVPVGEDRAMATLAIQGSPLFDAAQEGQATITVTYADKYGNEYELRIPVTRQPRAAGRFNPAIHWHEFTYKTPSLARRRLRQIGRA
jgi:hypothetical protein